MPITNGQHCTDLIEAKRRANISILIYIFSFFSLFFVYLFAVPGVLGRHRVLRQLTLTDWLERGNCESYLLSRGSEGLCVIATAQHVLLVRR